MLGNVIPPDSRSRFTDFKISMLTIFSMLSGENWNEFMYEGIVESGGYGILLYYVIVILCGIFIVLNLFLAILLAEFDAGEPPDMSLNGFMIAIGLWPGGEEEGDDAEDIGAALKEMEQNDFKASVNSAKDEPGKAIKKSSGKNSNQPMPGKTIGGGGTGTEQSDKPDKKPRRSSSMNVSEVLYIRDEQVAQEKEKAVQDYNTLHGTAMGILGPNNGFRKVVASVVRTQWFDNFILLLIVVTSIFLALDGPTVTEEDHKVNPWKTIKLLDKIFLGVFTGEILVKFITYGIFTESKYAYFKDSWNILDFSVVVIAWLPYMVDGVVSVNSLKTLRAMRALRPLRTIKRLPGLKIVVNVSMMCIPTFINICFVVFFCFHCVRDNGRSVLFRKVLEVQRRVCGWR
jgi:hypothetical protein